MATKKEPRLSVRMDGEKELLAWVLATAKRAKLSPSWVVRWALCEAKARGLTPLGPEGAHIQGVRP